MLEKVGVPALLVRSPEELARATRLIIPGGESTTMLKLLQRGELWVFLQKFVREYPVWGICAGAILLAQEVVNPAQDSLQAINLRAYRNFYGSQRESFSDCIDIPLLNRTMLVDFIRAPRLEALDDQPEAICFHNQLPVMFKQKNIIASTFHSELGADPGLHEFFVRL